MALIRAKPLQWRGAGLSDAIDGTNVRKGAMSSLMNLVPAPHTKGLYVPRPASTKLTDFSTSGITSPAQINALLQIGNIAYGMIASTSGTFSGKDVPYAYNVATNSYETITIPGGTTSLPTTPSASGDWTPPTMAIVSTRIIITHPGYNGSPDFFGWLDVSGFTDATVTGMTHSTTTIDTLSTDVLQSGWKPGMTITGTDIPANTTIVSIASDGLSLVLSHAATGSHSSITFTVTGGTGTAPLYGAGNANGAPLSAVPVAVFNFNQRAWYAVPKAGMVYSDSGNPTQVTNATQALTPMNGLDITSFGGLPLQQTTGGILQGLIAFQGDANMLQVTGDPATMNLAMNNVGFGVGTLAPNTIADTPDGLAFMAPDGVRILNFLGQVSNPIGAFGEGVLMPFLNAINPSRAVAAFNQNVYRISVKNGAKQGQPTEEYWFDFAAKEWTGPHSFPASIIAAFQAPVGATSGHGFILQNAVTNNTLWNSTVTPTLSASFTENGVPMNWSWATSLLPDNGGMEMNAVVETTFGVVLPPGTQLTITATDEAGNILDSVAWSGSPDAPTNWGGFNWGQANWGAGSSFFVQYPINWAQPLLFKQMMVTVTGTSLAGLTLGNLNLKYQILGYLTGQTAP